MYFLLLFHIILTQKECHLTFCHIDFLVYSLSPPGQCYIPSTFTTALKHDKHSANICSINEWNLELVSQGHKKIKPVNSYFQVALQKNINCTPLLIEYEYLFCKHSLIMDIIFPVFLDILHFLILSEVHQF